MAELPCDPHGLTSFVVHVFRWTKEHPGLRAADVRLLVAADEEEDVGPVLLVSPVADARGGRLRRLVLGLPVEEAVVQGVVPIARLRGEVLLILLQRDQQRVGLDALAPLHPLAEVARHEAANERLAQGREDFFPAVGGVDRQGKAGEGAEERNRDVIGLAEGVGQDLAEFVTEGVLRTERVQRLLVLGEATTQGPQ